MPEFDPIGNSSGSNKNNNNNNQNNQNIKFNSPKSDELQYLRSIDNTLKELLKNANNTSNASWNTDRPRRDDFKSNRDRSNRDRNGRGIKGNTKSFTDAFEQNLMDALLGSDFKKNLRGAFDNIADDLGVDFADIPRELGKLASNKLLKSARASKHLDVFKEFGNFAQSSVKDLQKEIDKELNKANEAYKASHNGQDAPWQTEREERKRKRAEDNRGVQRGNLPGTPSQRDDKTRAQFDRQMNQNIMTSSMDMMLDTLVDIAVTTRSIEQIISSGSDSSSSEVRNSMGDIASNGLDGLKDIINRKKNKGIDGKDIAKEAGSVILGEGAEDATKKVAGGMSDDVINGALGAIGKVAPQVAKGLGKFIPYIGPVITALTALDFATDLLAEGLEWAADYLTRDFKDALKHTSEAISKTVNTNNAMRTQETDAAIARMKADAELLVREPFDILTKAAQKLYDAWDNSIRTINQTQGYSKDELNGLIGNYAKRLRDEGLSAVVSSADITTNLEKVLEGGLSGQVAEEFAYLATKLSAAVPTQDWFGYASTYASVAAQQIQAGKSQAEAIQIANAQMEAFASNVLYASRQISGGFSTGLQNASDIFEKSVKIANAAHSDNLSGISGVLTSVGAIVGAVAPSLSSSIVDAVYDAAVGGNSSQLVALRSLAGINASNTEFLQQLAKNPQSVFTELFTNLGNMQKMSDEAYMEVAEGLSNIFGISQEALTQVDFNYLADAVRNMNTTSKSLEENMKLLASGESTTTKEQQVMAQINQYMIDEGLAYVLDNEVAREIQKHMWDEEMNNKLMAATYAVDIQGEAMSALTSLTNGLNNIFNFLTFGLFNAVTGIVQNTKERAVADASIATILQAGKVGNGNAVDFYKLTTYKSGMKSADSLVETFVKSALLTRDYTPSDSSVIGGGVNSQYNWGTVSKSAASSVYQLEGGKPSGGNLGGRAASSYSAEEAERSKMQSKLDRMIETMDTFIEEGQSFQDWQATAKNFGIADLNAAVEDVGYDMENLKNRFDQGRTNQAVTKELERRNREELFWDNMEMYELQLIDLTTYTNELLEDIYAKHCEFYNSWVDYFIKHKQYSAAYDHSSVSKVQQAEKGKSQDAIYALAEALTKNTVDLLDPTVQTNAILSQILLVVNAIMQQNNKATEKAGSSLPDTLSGLALGLINKT